MNNTATKTNSKFTIQQIAMIAVMTAVTCVLAPLSVPIGPVPISLTNLVIYFSLFILGTKKGTISYLIYLLVWLESRYFPALPAAPENSLVQPVVI